MPSPATEMLAEAFGALGPKCGRYWARCPVHDDQNPSLEIFEFDGRPCLLCWVCTPPGLPKSVTTPIKTAILKAVGLTWKDVLGDNPLQALPKQSVVARYDYRDEAGTLLYQTVRLEPGRNGRTKDFKQRRPDPNNPRKWVWNLEGARRVLYRLPELLKSSADEAVLLVGGEKDAEVGRALGFPSTTNVCGESSPWHEEYSRSLSGRKVVLVPHRDPTGWRFMGGVALSLIQNGCRVRWLALPGGPKPGFDLADYAAEQGGTTRKSDREALRGKLLRLIYQAPELPQWNLLTKPGGVA